jgi:hypothetical protein
LNSKFIFVALSYCNFIRDQKVSFDLLTYLYFFFSGGEAALVQVGAKSSGKNSAAEPTQREASAAAKKGKKGQKVSESTLATKRSKLDLSVVETF